MTDRVVLITGSTGGIGLRTAMALAKGGATVVLTGRSREAGAAAVATVKAEAGHDRVELLLGDLSTRAGVGAVAAQFKARHARLDVLLNNAGLMPTERTLTADGLERGFAVNVVAPLLLSLALMDRLVAARPARVVTLTGGEHPGRFDLDNLQGERAFVGLTTYSHHKLVMMAVMRELAERTRGSGVTVNVCYPGQAATAMTQGVTAGAMPLAMRLIYPLFRWMVRPDGGQSAQKASRSSVFLASSPEVDGVTGRYFDRRGRAVAWPAPVEDTAVRARLWETVSRLAGEAATPA